MNPEPTLVASANGIYVVSADQQTVTEHDTLQGALASYVVQLREARALDEPEAA